MPELATVEEYWDSRQTADDAQWRTQRDLRAISDRLGTEYLEVIIRTIANPTQPETEAVNA